MFLSFSNYIFTVIFVAEMTLKVLKFQFDTDIQSNNTVLV